MALQMPGWAPISYRLSFRKSSSSSGAQWRIWTGRIFHHKRPRSPMSQFSPVILRPPKLTRNVGNQFLALRSVHFGSLYPRNSQILLNISNTVKYGGRRVGSISHEPSEKRYKAWWPPFIGGVSPTSRTGGWPICLQL